MLARYQIFGSMYLVSSARKYKFNKNKMFHRSALSLTKNVNKQKLQKNLHYDKGQIFHLSLSKTIYFPFQIKNSWWKVWLK